MGQRRLGAGALCLAMAGGVGLLAAPAASAAPSTVFETGFESGTAAFFGRGDAKVAVSTAEARTGTSSLLTTGRTQAWNGPALDGKTLMPAGTYDIEAWVKLPAGSGADQVSLSVARTPSATGTTSYDSVAYQVAVNDTGWTKLSGQYTFATANSSLEVYLESPDATQQFFLDDVRIVGEAAAPVTPGTALPLSTDFESGLQGWAPRGDAKVAVTAGAGRNGTAGLAVTNRLQNWQGPAIDVTENVAIGQAVSVSVWAKLAPGQAPASLQLSVQRDKGTVTNYEGVPGAAAVVSADAWTELKGTYVLGAPIDKAQLYVEGTAGTSFTIDDLRLTPIVEEPIQDIPALKDVLGAQGFEHVSTAIDSRETVGRPSKLFTKQFNAFTPENSGKPESTEPTKGTFTFGDLDRLLDFADASGTKVYGHVLFWHSQTPAWFFQDDSGRQLTNSPADQAILLAHMDSHVKGIADHINARYAASGKTNPIWAWDVANETIDDSDNANAHDMRNSPYYQVLGEQWVAKGFGIADKYFPEQKLFLNDYNTEMPTKRADYLELIASLKAAGAPIDGVGHQAHVDFSRPIEWLDASLDAVEALDPTLLQAITELDVSTSAENNGADVSAGTVPQHRPGMAVQAEAETENGYYYRDLFAMLRTHSQSIESVTFWGISNARSWLRTWPAARPWEAPLPFGDSLEAKPAYWGIVDPDELAPRPSDQLAPRIAGHDTVHATSTSTKGAKVTYAVTAGDTRDGAVTAVCTPPSGSVFPIGTTKVTCTATDKAGNKANPVTFDVVVTPPPTTTALYSQINNGSVVRANVKQNVQVVVQFGNKGKGTLVGTSFAYSCTQKSGPAMKLELAPGSAQQVTNRDYPAGQNANFQLRGTPTQVGTATFDCTLTMTDGFGAKVTSTNTVTIDVRK
jgi:GH35 family endo-1,4-beta-xylanase